MENEISQTEPRLAWRYWSKAMPILYVAQLPGNNGEDYGYTNIRKGTLSRGEMLDAAIPLSPYWQKRFQAHCSRIGVVARFSIPENINIK